jgi:ribose 5-phosphate isomerase B
MKIHIASDHAGFRLKEELKVFLGDLRCSVTDHGASRMDPKDDYPDFISLAAKAVAADEESLGIVIGGSGQGESMAANKIPGIRSTVFYGQGKTDDGVLCADIITLSKQHNDANVLSLGARFITTEEAKRAVKCWIKTPFSGDERHLRRIDKIKDIEKNV